MSGLRDVWECPRCGSQVAAGTSTEGLPPDIVMLAPRCMMGHEAVEMEQKLAQAWNVPEGPE